MSKLYKNWTIRERMVGMLKAEYSATLVKETSKYWVYSAMMNGGVVYYFFLGASGAVRVNRTASSTTSLSKTEKFARLLTSFEQKHSLEVSP